LITAPRQIVAPPGAVVEPRDEGYPDDLWLPSPSASVERLWLLPNCRVARLLPDCYGAFTPSNRPRNLLSSTYSLVGASYGKAGAAPDESPFVEGVRQRAS